MQETILVLACPKSMTVLWYFLVSKAFANLAWDLIFWSECEPLWPSYIKRHFTKAVWKCTKC